MKLVLVDFFVTLIVVSVTLIVAFVTLIVVSATLIVVLLLLQKRKELIVEKTIIINNFLSIYLPALIIFVKI